MTDAQRNLMNQVWMRGCDYPHVVAWASVYGVAPEDIPSEDSFNEFCMHADAEMDEFFRREMELSTEEIF